MACNDCGTSSCSCVTSCCTTECNCLGVEDLCLGFGTMEQIRCGKKTLVTKLNGTHILLTNNAHNHTNVQEFVEHATESIDTIWDKVKCDQVQILTFTCCDDMENYTGTTECPLVSGQLAVVQNPDEACFGIYKYSQIVQRVQLGGEVCGSFRGYQDVITNRWTEHSECTPKVLHTELALQDFSVTEEPAEPVGKGVAIEIVAPTQPASEIIEYQDSNTVKFIKAGWYLIRARIATAANADNDARMGIVAGKDVNPESDMDLSYMSKDNSGQAHVDLYLSGYYEIGDTFDLFYVNNGRTFVGDAYSGENSSVVITRIPGGNPHVSGADSCSIGG